MQWTLIKIYIIIVLLLLIMYMCNEYYINISLLKSMKSLNVWTNQMLGDNSKGIEGSRQQEDNEFQVWWKGQKNLKKKIKEICARYGEQVNVGINPFWFIYIKKANLLNCYISKAGSNTVKKLLFQLDRGHSYEEDIIHMSKLHNLTLKNASNKNNINSSTVSFTIVRHPFERLVSAFQDTMIDRTSPTELKHLKRYFDEITFSKFVKHILLDRRERCRTMAECHFNHHWLPYVTSCSLCTFEYTAVGRLENMQEDLRFIGQMAGVQFKNNVSHPSSGSTSQLAREYFSQVDKEDVEQLYKLYKIDFEMFGYSPYLYVNIAKN